MKGLYSNIVISGPGETFGYELSIITEALRNAGCIVEVEDEHPPTKEQELSHNEYIRDIMKKGHEVKVKIKTVHYPWGG